ncbi:hypothetical protein NBM05_08375 [Rothia sp. AR01]|uniref:DUF2188 domain-containing protein n=1 Tax=Rothia santali TaxID=2949643 RepID=A0A9X2HHX3_9MICC|nr:hypothetical protein [Rothia santali]MCP3426016.1 hypothetical protein [Rothia santali]
MSENIYVYPVGDNWRVTLPGTDNFREYRTKENAIGEAKRNVNMTGCHAQVLTSADGQVEEVIA